MARIGPKNSKPEIIVRKIAHAMGYRFRLHAKELPGKPDIVFRPRKKVIFVHGCFWHRHPNCKKTTTPKTRLDFWQHKFLKNQERDTRVQNEILSMGWEYLIIWECETKNIARIQEKLLDFLK